MQGREGPLSLRAGWRSGGSRATAGLPRQRHTWVPTGRWGTPPCFLGLPAAACPSPQPPGHRGPPQPGAPHTLCHSFPFPRPLRVRSLRRSRACVCEAVHPRGRGWGASQERAAVPASEGEAFPALALQRGRPQATPALPAQPSPGGRSPGPRGTWFSDFLATVFPDGGLPCGASGHLPVLHVCDRHRGGAGGLPLRTGGPLGAGGGGAAGRGGTRASGGACAGAPGPQSPPPEGPPCSSSPPQALIVVYAFRFPHLLNPQIGRSAHRRRHRQRILHIVLRGPALCFLAAGFSLFFYPVVSRNPAPPPQKGPRVVPETEPGAQALDPASSLPTGLPGRPAAPGPPLHSHALRRGRLRRRPSPSTRRRPSCPECPCRRLWRSLRSPLGHAFRVVFRGSSATRPRQRRLLPLPPSCWARGDSSLWPRGLSPMGGAVEHPGARGRVLVPAHRAPQALSPCGLAA